MTKILDLMRRTRSLESLRGRLSRPNYFFRLLEKCVRFSWAQGFKITSEASLEAYEVLLVRRPWYIVPLCSRFNWFSFIWWYNYGEVDPVLMSQAWPATTPLASLSPSVLLTNLLFDAKTQFISLENMWPYPVLNPSLLGSKSTFSQPFKRIIRAGVRISSIIIFRLSERWKAKFSILCGVLFLVTLQGKFEIDRHSWKWES